MVHCNARSDSHQGRPIFHSSRAIVTTMLVLAGLLGTQRTSIAQEKDREKADVEKEKLNLALCEAIQKNDVPTVRALIKDGADLKWPNPKNNRKTPLIIAMMYTQAKPQAKLDMVKLLLDSGADVHFADGKQS